MTQSGRAQAATTGEHVPSFLGGSAVVRYLSALVVVQDPIHPAVVVGSRTRPRLRTPSSLNVCAAYLVNSGTWKKGDAYSVTTCRSLLFSRAYRRVTYRWAGRVSNRLSLSSYLVLGSSRQL